MLLSNYDYKVKFHPGVTNANADGLSHVNHGPADDSTLSILVVCETPAFPDLPVCLDTMASSVPAVETAADAAASPVLGPR